MSWHLPGSKKLFGLISHRHYGINKAFTANRYDPAGRQQLLWRLSARKTLTLTPGSPQRWGDWLSRLITRQILMSSSISGVTLPSLESRSKNAIRNSSEIKFCMSSLWHLSSRRMHWNSGADREMVREGVELLFYISEIWTPCEKALSKQICLKSALGEKKMSLLLWGANCGTSSVLFIAVWMFLLTAHLCADWAVKILSSCSKWTGSHIQGHYVLGVRKIKHQITLRLGFFSLEIEQFSGSSTVMHYNVWISSVISALIRKTSVARVKLGSG